MSKIEQQVRIGQPFAFSCGFRGEQWQIYKVEKITPSGRFKCGPYECNPDRTVRGRRTAYSPIRAEDVTEEILDAIEFRQLKQFFEKIKVNDLSRVQLKKIREIVRQGYGAKNNE